MEPQEYASEYDLIRDLLRTDPEITTQELIDACIKRNPNSKINPARVANFKSLIRKEFGA